MEEKAYESMIIRSSKAGEFLRTNNQFLEEVGYSNDELNQKPFVDWIHKDDRETFLETIENKQSCNVRHKTKSGGDLRIDVMVKDLGDGPMILGLNGTYHEISQFGNTTTEDVTVKSTLHSIARIIEEQNPGYICSILMVADGKFVAGAGPSLPDDYNNAIDGFSIGPTVGSCGTAIYWNVPVIVEDIQKDPLWAPFAELAKKAGIASCWSHPFVAKGGQVLGAIAFYSREPKRPTDEQLSRLRAAAKLTGLAVERGRAEEQLRLANEIKLRFMANMSHEIRTPLNALIGITDLISNTHNKLSREDLGLLRDSSEQLLELFSGVLELTELPGRSTNEKNVDLLKCCTELVESFRPQAVKKGIDLECYLSINIPQYVLIDQWAFERMLNLLIENAVKFTHSGKVSVSFEYEDHKLKVNIIDTGCGIDFKHLSELREPFVQGDDSSTKRFRGFGLGLALSDLCIKSLGGELTFEPCLLSGTEVKISVPIVLGEEPQEKNAVKSPFEDIESDLPILIAEDNQVNGKVIGKILERSGFSFEIVLNGEEAVEAYKSKSYCCVLMDCQMPVMDGYEATREIRTIEIDTKKHIPIIAVTANALTGDRDLCLKSGMDDYLKKPIRKDKLINKLEEHLKIVLLSKEV